MSTNPSKPIEQPAQPQVEHQGADVHGLPTSKCVWKDGDSLQAWSERFAEAFVKALNKSTLEGRVTL